MANGTIVIGPKKMFEFVTQNKKIEGPLSQKKNQFFLFLSTASYSLCACIVVSNNNMVDMN
jgi:hypothetical protein